MKITMNRTEKTMIVHFENYGDCQNLSNLCQHKANQAREMARLQTGEMQDHYAKLASSLSRVAELIEDTFHPDGF